MTDTADWLVESVFPDGVPVRQWVLSVPWKLRYLLARDAKLKRKVLKIFLSEVFRLLRRLSKSSAKAKGGSVTSVQRFGSALNLNVHLHCLVLDGVYEGGVFRRAEAPSEEDLQELVERVAKRVSRAAKRAGYELNPDQGMGAAGHEEEASVFDGIQSASIKGMLAFPTAEGLFRKVKLLGRKGYEPKKSDPTSAQFEGFSVHAGVRVSGTNRQGLAQVCRYVLRPPFATERINVDGAGRVIYELRKPRGDGATHLVMEPVEFIEKLAALVPPPRAHTVQYHGILAPNSKWRKSRKDVEQEPTKEKPGGSAKRRRNWAELLQKTFGVDAMRCGKCGGRMELIAVIRKAQTIKKVLTAMGWDVDELESSSQAPVPRTGVDPPEPEPWMGQV